MLVADDSLLARELLKEIISRANDMEIVAEAENGREAVEKNIALHPDLIVMDLEMPVMGGMDAITEIMCTRALPILVSSDVANAGNAYEAIRRGALDAVGKPGTDPESVTEFISKIRILAGVPVITHIKPVRTAARALHDCHDLTAKSVHQSANAPDISKVFVIASSTGGPQALSKILPRLPYDFCCPVLVAQHISDGFAEGMASWLSSLCNIPVKIAGNGETVEPGKVYISPPEYHTVLTQNRRIAFLQRHESDMYRPSCDRLLESVAALFGPRSVGIILTGMGHDGVNGMQAIMKEGGMTIAQSMESSLIYGMNRCAVEAGHVHRILHESEIGDEMLRICRESV